MLHRRPPPPGGGGGTCGAGWWCVGQSVALSPATSRGPAAAAGTTNTCDTNSISCAGHIYHCTMARVNCWDRE